MKENDWRSLLHTIRKGDCILFLGPEMATAAQGKGRRPLIELLAEHLADEIDGEGVVNGADLAHVARKYSMVHSPFDLKIAAESFYKQHAACVSQPYRDLASLPFNLVVNTTHDACFKNALTEAGKSCAVSFYDYNGKRPDLAPEGTAMKPLLYYMYGAIEEPNSLVLSENDLLDFLVSVIAKEPPLPANISGLFKERTKCFLFLGFSFKNWYLRILFHVLQSRNRSIRSFALEQMNAFDESYQGAILFYRDAFKLHLYSMDEAEFTGELKQRYQAQYGAEPATEGADVDDALDGPVAFVCHASEDAGFAKQLSGNLQKSGINTWLDKKDLRGGDAWDKEIEGTIEEVDYFLILQSASLQAKFDSYVNREIKLSLKRKERFRDPLKFIFPLEIDGSGRLKGFDELDAIQSIPFSTDFDAGLSELVKEIQRDFQRRKKLAATHE